MKIAISGSVSTGKTTLGKALADKLGVAFIEENLETIFRVTQAEKNDPTKRADLFMKCLERKRALELKEQSFVVDRCPVDMAIFIDVPGARIQSNLGRIILQYILFLTSFVEMQN